MLACERLLWTLCLCCSRPLARRGLLLHLSPWPAHVQVQQLVLSVGMAMCLLARVERDAIKYMHARRFIQISRRFWKLGAGLSLKDNEALIRGINAAATRVPTTIFDGPAAAAVPTPSLAQSSQDNSGAGPTDAPLTAQASVNVQNASPNISKCELMRVLCAWCITCVFASRIRAFLMHTPLSL